MNSDSPAPIPSPIPIPPRQRWRSLRQRAVPAVIFAFSILAVVLLWKRHLAAPVMVGQAEPVVANVTSYKPGILAELTVSRFQRVKCGDPVGRVMVTDPKILASSLAVIQAEIELLRTDVTPVLIQGQQQTAMDYDQLRLNWLRERTQFATAQVNLQLAETEHRRMETLFKEKIVAERQYEQAKAARDRLQKEVEELNKLVCEGEKNLQALQPAHVPDIALIKTNSLIAAIALQESKLRLAEAELSPVILKAPIDGTVTTLFNRPGEAVSAAQPILAIATLNPVRIVGYMRPPILTEPQPGMKVQIRTRGWPRTTSWAQVKEVGTQLETIPATLLGPVKFSNIELGLPVDISLPPDLKIRAGELVDVRLPISAN